MEASDRGTELVGNREKERERASERGREEWVRCLGEKGPLKKLKSALF